MMFFFLFLVLVQIEYSCLYLCFLVSWLLLCSLFIIVVVFGIWLVCMYMLVRFSWVFLFDGFLVVSVFVVCMVLLVWLVLERVVISSWFQLFFGLVVFVMVCFSIGIVFWQCFSWYSVWFLVISFFGLVDLFLVKYLFRVVRFFVVWFFCSCSWFSISIDWKWLLLFRLLNWMVCFRQVMVVGVLLVWQVVCEVSCVVSDLLYLLEVLLVRIVLVCVCVFGNFFLLQLLIIFCSLLFILVEVLVVGFWWVVLGYSGLVLVCLLLLSWLLWLEECEDCVKVLVIMVLVRVVVMRMESIVLWLWKIIVYFD